MSVHKLTAVKAKARREGWLPWIRSEADERAALGGCAFRESRAEHVVEFFRRFLVHSKGEWAGKPFELLDWQREDLIYPLFGWVRADGHRRFRRSYCELPKKNGKSTIAAGIGLYMLVGDGEAGAQVYSAATDRDQASIVHGEAINMVDASPALTAKLRINRSTRNIYFPQTRSYYRALSSSPAGKEGLDGHLAVIDELHVFRGRELWDALRFMGRARRQPLIFVITTAGDDLASVCYEQHEYAKKILSGEHFDERFFAYVRDCPREDLDGDGIYDRENWRRANPSMGITIDEGEFAHDVEEAVKTPTSMASFLRYSFNIWATSENPWLKIEWWTGCRREFTAEALAGRVCGAGLDLAKLLDMTAFALVFPDMEEEDLFRMLCWFWMPRDIAEERKDLAPYLTWAEQGWLTLTDGDVCDYETVERKIGEASRQYRIHELAFDPWNAEATKQRIEKDYGIKCHEFRQAPARFADPTKEFERLLRAGRLLNDGNPILQWQAGHVRVKTDASGNIRPVKQKHGDHRTIDGVVAGVMALDRALHTPRPVRGSLLIY